MKAYPKSRISYKRVARGVVLLTKRRFPTKSHESAWQNYEQYLEVRTVVYMTAKSITFILGLALGLEHFQIAENQSE